MGPTFSPNVQASRDDPLAGDANLMTVEILPISTCCVTTTLGPTTVKHFFICKNFKFIFQKLAVLLFFGIISTGCVSVKFAGTEAKKSTDVKLVTPDKPFAEMKSAHIDRSWQNSKNGNIISYLSDCENPTDPSLENIFKGITSEIDQPQVIQSNPVEFNQRQALHAIVDGNVDGMATRFELMLFKKNNCLYVLTYAAAAAAFAENQRDFAQFVKGFKVP